MTGYTVHTGSNQKFSSGWDRIFDAAGPKKGTAKAAATNAAKVKKTGKKKSRG